MDDDIWRMDISYHCTPLLIHFQLLVYDYYLRAEPNFLVDLASSKFFLVFRTLPAELFPSGRSYSTAAQTKKRHPIFLNPRIPSIQEMSFSLFFSANIYPRTRLGRAKLNRNVT